MMQATTALFNCRVQRQDAILLILSMLLVPSSMDHSEETCKRLLSGEIYGHAMLHHSREDGYKAICPVTFMWRPYHRNKNIGTNDRGSVETMEIKSSSFLRQFWIWIHPSAFSEGLDCIQLACQMMANEKGILVSCVSLDGQLAKLDVMGSRAFRLLQKIMHPITFGSSLEDPSQLRHGSISENSGKTGACEIKQNNILEKEEGFSSSAVILLTVLDPRFSCDKRAMEVPEVHLTDNPSDSLKDKNKDNSTLEEEFSTLQTKYDNVSSFDNCQDLWDASNGVHPPIEEHILCLERHQKSLDYFHMKNTSSMKSLSMKGQSSRFCPIMLLRNVNEPGLHDGWAIILPICWVKAFWIPLISCGAHAIGLREKHWIACDVGLPYFPSDFPDCNANPNLMEKEASRIDNKIDNYSILTKPSEIPIKLPWDSKWFAYYRIDFSSNLGEIGDNLADQGKLSDKPLDVFVARTSRMLTSFLKEVSGQNFLLFPKEIGRPKFSRLMMKEADISLSLNLNSWTSERKKLCYLRVVLHAFKEGVFEDRAVVYAPRYSDITLLTSRLENNEGLKVPHAYVDSYLKELPSGKLEFQLPEDPAAREAFRSPIGFVTTGFVRGSKKPGAVAYCEALLLAQVRYEQWSRVAPKKRRKEIFVLVRNLRSTVYRLALATIVLERQEQDVESF